MDCRGYKGLTISPYICRRQRGIITVDCRGYNLIKVTISRYICRRQRGIITVDCRGYKGLTICPYICRRQRGIITVDCRGYNGYTSVHIIYVGANEALLQWIVDIIKVTISPYICRGLRGIITVDCRGYKGYNQSIYMSALTRHYYSGL